MRLATLVLLAGLAGCATMKPIFGPSTPYDATVCVTGAVPLACQALGTIDLPEAGTTFVQLALALAGPLLTKQAHFKACVFTAYPATVDRTIVVTASAACTLNGLPVDEQIVVSLAPKAPPA